MTIERRYALIGHTHPGGGGVTDHGALTGLADDDHPQYALDTDLTTHEADTTTHGISVFGATLVDDADAATARTTLGAAAASHTHVAADVTDFSEAVDDRVSSLVVDGTGIDAVYNDGANTLTIGLADVATQTIKARKTAGTGAPEDCTLSEVLDFVTSAAKGDILVRNSTSWQRVPVGTDRQVLTADSAAAAGVSYQDADLLAGQVVYQDADASITSTTAWTDTDLSIYLDTGRYALELITPLTAHATPDMNIQLDFSGTATSVYLMSAVWGVATGNSVQTAFNVTGSLTTTGLHMRHTRGGFTVTVAGTLTFQFAQNSSSVNAITVHANSWMRITKLA